jgi:hypothetical protein
MPNSDPDTIFNNVQFESTGVAARNETMTENVIAKDLEIDFLHEIGSRMAAADPLHEVWAQIVNFASDLVKCEFISWKETN